MLLLICRLTESSSSGEGSSKVVNVPKRYEPTSDAKVAGQAALARIEGAKSNAPKLKT